MQPGRDWFEQLLKLIQDNIRDLRQDLTNLAEKVNNPDKSEIENLNDRLESLFKLIEKVRQLVEDHKDTYVNDQKEQSKLLTKLQIRMAVIATSCAIGGSVGTDTILNYFTKSDTQSSHVEKPNVQNP